LRLVKELLSPWGKGSGPVFPLQSLIQKEDEGTSESNDATNEEPNIIGRQA
jgi:hypothetical protein